MTYHRWCWPWSPGWGTICQVFPFSYWTLWKEVTTPTPYCRSDKLQSTSLRADYIRKSFATFLHRFDCSPLFIYLFNLYQFRVISIYFIIWVTIRYYFMLLPKLFQFCPLGAISITSLCSFEKPPSLRGSVSTALLSSTTWCSRFILCIPAPALESWFLILETGIRTQGLGVRYAYCYWGGVDSRPSQLTKQRTVCDHTNLCLYTHL